MHLTPEDILDKDLIRELTRKIFNRQASLIIPNNFLSKEVAKRYQIRNKKNYFGKIITPRVVNIKRIWDSEKIFFSRKKYIIKKLP